MGEAQGNARLTDAQVLEIRARYRPGRAPYRTNTSLAGLGREYGVSKFMIHHIVKGMAWRHLL